MTRCSLQKTEPSKSAPFGAAMKVNATTARTDDDFNGRDLTTDLTENTDKEFPSVPSVKSVVHFPCHFLFARVAGETRAVKSVVQFALAFHPIRIASPFLVASVATDGQPF
jgi:hypothetical protein